MRVRGIVAGVSAIALASLLVASPASAATLPSGQVITVVNSTELEAGIGFQQMFEPSPATAIASTTGAAQPAPIVMAIDVNDDGIGYALSYLVLNEPVTFVPSIFNANANTGQLSGGVPIVPAPLLDITINDCRGLDLQPSGEVLTACTFVNADNNLVASYIGVVDPVTGFFTPFVTNGGVQQNPNVFWAALAYNAVTGELWAFGSNDGDVNYLVDRAAGALGPRIESEPIYGADFDRDGQLFVMSIRELLATADPAAGTIAPIDVVTSSEGIEMELVESITVWGNALPATGPAEILPLGLGTAMLFLAGAAFIATSRIKRRGELAA